MQGPKPTILFDSARLCRSPVAKTSWRVLALVVGTVFVQGCSSGSHRLGTPSFNAQPGYARQYAAPVRRRRPAPSFSGWVYNRIAGLGRLTGIPRPRGSVTGGSRNIHWAAPPSCLAPALRRVIATVATHYGAVRVNSTCRSREHNRRVGGAPHSYHLTGDAADIRVSGNWREAHAYLRRSVGGFKHYGGGLFHIDLGPRRRF